MILIIEISKNIPTPTPTVTIRSVLFMILSTWLDKTCKSGSAIVIKKPNTKDIISKINNFLVFVRPIPLYSPIGVIAISAPKLNRLIPIINTIALITNTIISVELKEPIGVNPKIKTNSEIGRD